MIKSTPIRTLFWITVAVVIITIVGMSITALIHTIFFPFVPALGVILILGIVLTIFISRAKIAGREKKLLLLTGIAAIGMPVMFLAHAFFLEKPAGVLSFTISLYVVTAVFLFAAVSSVVLDRKSRTA